ncbi:MAG: integration host factor subunit alpha [Desulfobacterales bacterium]
MALTKAQMVMANSKLNGFSINQSSEIIETLLELIKKTLASGEDVLISNFGRLCVKEKKERKGRNPATGEDMMLPPRRIVTFKCSGTLRRKINDQQN